MPPKAIEDLTKAVSEGDTEAVARALAAGADPSATICGLCWESTLLIEAAVEGHLAVVKLLLDAGADVHGTGDRDGPGGETALHCAARHGHIEVLRELVARGADVNSADENDDTPLHAALDGKHAKAVHALLQLGASATPIGSSSCSSTPLHLAAAWGDTAVIQALLDAGADVTAVPPPGSSSNATPLAKAARAGREAAVRLLYAAWPDMPKQTLCEAVRAALEKYCDLHYSSASDDGRGTPQLRAFAFLAKHLRGTPEGHQQLSNLLWDAMGGDNEHLELEPDTIIACLDAWAQDTATIDEQRAALAAERQALAAQKRAVQQLVIGAAELLKRAAAAEEAGGGAAAAPAGKRQKRAAAAAPAASATAGKTGARRQQLQLHSANQRALRSRSKEKPAATGAKGGKSKRDK